MGGGVEGGRERDQVNLFAVSAEGTKINIKSATDWQTVSFCHSLG